MDANIWNMWDGKHDSADQKKRLTSAKKANLTPLSIDADNGIGNFAGSTNYVTTLSDCTCIDFVRRRLPCKHMYRLAIELGIIDETAKTDQSQIRVPKSERADLFTIVEIIETTLNNKQIDLLHNIIKDILFKHHSAIAIKPCSESDELIAHGLLVLSNDNNAFFEGITRTELIERLEDHGLSGFKKNTKKADLIEWTQKNVSDISSLFPDLQVVNINSKLEGIQKKVYTYLMRRNDKEECYNPDTNRIESIPKGAEFKTSNGNTKLELRFPNDEITILLDKYGKNRCAKWDI